MITDEKLEYAILSMMKRQDVNVNLITTKMVILYIEKKYKIDLSSRYEQVKQIFRKTRSLNAVKVSNRFKERIRIPEPLDESKRTSNVFKMNFHKTTEREKLLNNQKWRYKQDK